MIGCKTPTIVNTVNPCPRGAVWEDGMLPTKEYAFALSIAFQYQNGRTTQHMLISDRLNVLEKYCYKMRAK